VLNLVKDIELSVNETSIWFLGQSSFIIKTIDGIVIGIDLFLSNSVEKIYGYKRMTPIMINPKELKCDIIITTHFHEDHFDPDTLAYMNLEKSFFIGAIDCIQPFNKLFPNHKGNKVFLKNGEKIEINKIAISALKCDHGTSAPFAIGILIEVDGKKIYFTGDTSLRLDYAYEVKRFGIIDVLILPINGANGNLDSKDAVKLIQFLEPRIVIPAHFWTFIEHKGNPLEFFDLFKASNIYSTNLHFMQLGEKLNV
jgi:L-ascorbate 6-phosphate lactonase